MVAKSRSMKFNPDICGYIGCGAPAIIRGRTIVPDEPIARCYAHGGHHHYFTERQIDGVWRSVEPVEIRVAAVDNLSAR